ncbi:metallophosphoesterase, partial [Streptococcus mitis]|nr:metallophosphoesterase [Streptococcus mitis]
SEDNPEQGAIGKEQMEWAKQDIQAARDNGANWIILAYHKHIYSASYHALQDEDVQVTREEFAKLADELDVDVVLQGHDHN